MSGLTTTGQGPIAAAVGVLRRRWLPGLLAALAVLATVAVILLTAKPVYRADARLRLGEPPPTGGVSPTAGFIGLLRLGGDPFANDLELLASRTVAERVVEDVTLHARLDAPRYWHRDSVFEAFNADRTTIKATYRADFGDDGRVRITRLSPEESLIAHIGAGESVSFDGIHAVFRPRRASGPSSVRIVTLPFDDAAREVAERIRVERTRREANVLSIVFEDIDPAVARATVASAVRRFVELRSNIQGRESAETVDSLRAVAYQTQEELADAEDALEAWQRKSRMIAPEAQSEAFVQRYTALISDRELAAIEQAAIDSTLKRLERELEPSRAWVTLLAYPRFLENDVVGALMARMAELEETRLELVSRRAETSREATVLRGQIVSLDASLRQLAASYQTAVVERIGDLDGQITRMDAELAAVPGDAVELGRRQRDVRLLSELVVLTEQRLRQEELRRALTIANVQTIDPPQLRRRQVWPRPKLGAAVGLVVAGGFGLLGMAAAERADPSVRGAAAVRTLTESPVVATPLRSRGAITVTAADAAAVAALALRHGYTALSVTAITTEPAAAVAQALAAAGVEIALHPTDGATAYAAAVEAARRPVLLVLENAHTRRRDVRMATERVREAGGTLAGSLLICGSSREAAAAWG